MLTEEEIDRVKLLTRGAVLPKPGMEMHFLRVIRGEAIPCSPKEREWFEVALELQEGWRVRSYETVRPLLNLDAGEVVERLRAEVAARDAVIAAQERELEYWNNLDPAHAEDVAGLKAKISLLEGFLSECHKALAKYERLPPPLVTDVQGENEKMMKAAEKRRFREVLQMDSNYSNIDGQD